MSAHSILPPSGAAAWRRCAMWVTMNSMYPQDDTPESMEGTAAHWVFAQMLDSGQVTEGIPAPNGTVVTGDMIDGGELFVDAVRERVPQGVDLHVEEPVSIPSVHPECWGTPDVWAYVSNIRTLLVFDYKFGHMFVDEFENEQGVAYVSGILAKLRPEIGSEPVIIEFIVVQPRCYYAGAPVRMWRFSERELIQIRADLQESARLALAAEPVATTNPECGFCPGKHACLALQKAAYWDAEFSVKASPMELPPEAASLELRMMERSLERLTARVDGLKETVAVHARAGHNVPYHKLTQTYGRRQWTLPVDQVLSMGTLMGVDLSKSGVRTPKQAIASGIDETVIKAYSATSMGALKLTPVTPDDARRAFSTNYEQD